MGLGILGIFKLSGNQTARNGRCQLIGFLNGAGHALGTRSQHDFSTIGFQQISALLAHGVRHGENYTITQGSADCRQAYSRVAGSGLNNGGSWSQFSGAFRLTEHPQGHSVLDTACGVEILQLAKQPAGQSPGLCKAGSFQQRSTSH